MKENFYQFYEEKANHCEQSPRSSSEALQRYPENLSAMPLRSRRAIIFRTKHKHVVIREINALGLMQGSKIPRSGRWCEENSNRVGRQRLSPDGLKTNTRHSLPATRPFINGSIAMNAAGSLPLYAPIADDCPVAILTGTEGFTSPRGHPSNNGHDRFWPDVVWATGRLTP